MSEPDSGQPLSVIILTFNSDRTIGQTLESLRGIADDVRIVDSYSTDRTLAIAEQFGARVVQHPFRSYGDQRNWAMDHLPRLGSWLLHLDSDEFLSLELAQEIKDVLTNPSQAVGYFIPRLVRFLGRDIRHGGMYPTWHMRLFRNGQGRCEDRKYDQHFVVDGSTGRMRFPMIDDHRSSLSEWTRRHNLWSDAEVEEILHPYQGEDRVIPRVFGNPIERKRSLRRIYGLALPLVRPWLLFLYRYVIRAGFLDGREGFIFFSLQTLWFRFLVDAKLFEKQKPVEGRT